jgi:hypothetical protein
MFDKNLASYAQQYYSAQYVQIQTVFASETMPEIYAGSGKIECHQADDRNRQQYRRRKQGKRNAYRKRVNARSQRQPAQRPDIHRIECFFVAVFPEISIINHSSAKISQKNEGYPMVVVANVTAERASEKNPQESHAGLKQRHHGRYPEYAAGSVIAQDNAARRRNGKAVHRQSDGKQNDFPEVHYISFSIL